MVDKFTNCMDTHTEAGPQIALQAELQNQDEPRPSVWMHQPADSEEWQLSEDEWRGIAEAAHVAPLHQSWNARLIMINDD